MSGEVMPEAEAIRLHLQRPRERDDGMVYSAFWAALRDARRATNRDAEGNKIRDREHGSWLGAVGYMALLDQIGSCFKPRGAARRSGSDIHNALGHFSELPNQEIEALYALRCSFAHDFCLVNVKLKHPERTHHFVVTEGPGTRVVTLPRESWSGDFGTMTQSNGTRVNLEAFGDKSETICQRLFDLADDGQLEIVLEGGSDDLLRRYQLQAGPYSWDDAE